MSGERLCEGFGVRPMVADDVDAVLEVEHSAYPVPWPREVFVRELKQDWSHIDVVHPEGDEAALVAHIVYWVVHDELHILNVAVHESMRRRGLGRAMIQRLLALCQREQLQVLTLEVRVGNHGAIALYESFGFSTIGRRKRYYADNGEDALVMALVLEEQPPQAKDDPCQVS